MALSLLKVSWLRSLYSATVLPLCLVFLSFIIPVVNGVPSPNQFRCSPHISAKPSPTRRYPGRSCKVALSGRLRVRSVSCFRRRRRDVGQEQCSGTHAGKLHILKNKFISIAKCWISRISSSRKTKKEEHDVRQRI